MSIQKYLSIYNVPGTVLGGDRKKNKQNRFTDFMGIYLRWGWWGDDNEQ